MATFDHGGVQSITNATFMSTFDMIKLDKEGELNKVFGSQRLTGIMEMFGMKKATTSSQYDWWEQNRIMPKIKATTAGAAAGAATTFTLAADDYLTYTYDTPSQYNSTVTKDNVPVRVGDQIAVRPASGTTSASTLIRCIVYSVNASAHTFVAYPMDPADSVAAIGTAEDIIIFSNAHGEGSAQPLGLTTKVTKRTNNTQIFKENYKITGTADGLKTYFKYNGSDYYGVMGEADTATRFANLKEMGMLYSDNTTNQTFQNLLATAGTPFATTQGVIPTVLERGNVYDYSSITGMTIADFEDLVVTIDTQKGSKRNTLFTGLSLNIQLDRELRDQFKNGGVSYGTFTMDASKAVNLGFTTFEIAGYVFDKKGLDAFNDLQTFGASGYNFKEEALMIPGEKISDPQTGVKVDPISIRYLQGNKSNLDVRVEAVDLFKTGSTGEDAFEMRYKSENGMETPGANRFSYIKQA